MRSQSSMLEYEALTIRHQLIVVVAALVLGLSDRAAPAGFIPVYGGPTYDAGSGSGFPIAAVPEQRGINAAGRAVATARRPSGTIWDWRVFRWDSNSGVATELGTLGVSPAGLADVGAAGIDAQGSVYGLPTATRAAIRPALAPCAGTHKARRRPSWVTSAPARPGTPMRTCSA
jgi:hypothetical protein